MISLFVRASLALLVFNALLTPAEAFRNRETNYGTYERGYNSDNGYPKTVVGTSSGLPTQPPTRRGLGISAWGIVFVVVALILAGMGLYYFSICYGICRPTTKKYDKMGMPTLA
ncbi:unnamed protein product [Spodoptera littoralis]|uniref:Uncharacterized protein n=2 Tax=Spodoptera TaxID=7106 RepID=A0A9P0N2U2_SPOLI|nr:uncharacterized protein LOC111353454 [Spodoptera litura]CAH1639473.1 unnamed protein product [Spodoptera littoralis]